MRAPSARRFPLDTQRTVWVLCGWAAMAVVLWIEMGTVFEPDANPWLYHALAAIIVAIVAFRERATLLPLLRTGASPRYWLMAGGLGATLGAVHGLACAWLVVETDYGVVPHLWMWVPSVDTFNAAGPAADALDPTVVNAMLPMLALLAFRVIGEEALMRGALLERLTASSSARTAMWLSASLYALMHLGIPGFPVLMALAWFAARLRVRTNSLWPSALAAATHAVVAGLTMLLLVGAMQTTAGQ